MNPQEHYEESEHWLAIVDQQMDLVRKLTADADNLIRFGDPVRADMTSKATLAVIPTLNLTVAVAQVHATLALQRPVSTCGHGNPGLCMDCLTFTLENALRRP